MSSQTANPNGSAHATGHFKSRGSNAWTDSFGSIGDTIAGLMAIAISGDASPIALSKVERASLGTTINSEPLLPLPLPTKVSP
jgi:hypothetical protein